MSKPITVAPWKLGFSQSATLAAASAKVGTANVGTETRALLISVTTQNARIAISPGGQDAATAANLVIKATDPPVLVGCSPGDNVQALGSGAVVTMTELTS